MDAAPIPWELTRVDPDTHEINLPVIVLGTAARQLMQSLFDQVSNEGWEVTDRTGGGDASCSYAALQLGVIRDFTSRLHLYGFENDGRLATMVGEYARAAAGVVFAFGEAPDDQGALLLAAVARSTAPAIPVAALGPAEVAKCWQALHDTPVVFAGDAEDASIVPAVKAVAREMLSALKSG